MRVKSFLEISKFFPILALIVASAAAQVNADESPPPVGISLWQKICAPTKGVLLNLSGAIFFKYECATCSPHLK